MADAENRTRLTDRELLEEIDRKVDVMTAGLEALNAKVAELSTDDTELTAAVEAAASGFAAIEHELEELKTNHGTTDEELAPVTEAVSNAAAAVSGAISKLQAATPDEPSPV
jgi:outer membrane murein-binding lipoprotein Lpp